MHRPAHARPDLTKLSGVHRKLRRVRKPGWNGTQHDLTEYKPSAQELLEKKLRLMSKEQLMRLAGITPPAVQQTMVSQSSDAEAGLSNSGEDKENTRPETISVAARPSKSNQNDHHRCSLRPLRASTPIRVSRSCECAVCCHGGTCRNACGSRSNSNTSSACSASSLAGL